MESRTRQPVAATLLIAGGEDVKVYALNRRAQQYLHCENRLEIVSNATHLFEEDGGLVRVAEQLGDWILEKSAMWEENHALR